jgi:hypothetical protein
VDVLDYGLGIWKYLRYGGICYKNCRICTDK